MISRGRLRAIINRKAAKGENMSRTIAIELKMPKDWRQFRLPPALHDRLQELLDRQDQNGKLLPKEKREAKALTELVDMLSIMKARAALAARRAP
jgi:hypothetical protein